MMHVWNQESRSAKDIVVQEWTTHVEKNDLVDYDQHTCEYLSSESLNVPVTDELDEGQASCSLDAKETTASHIPLLVWVMWTQPSGFQH